LRLEILDSVFNTTSWTAIGEMKIDELRSGYRAIMDIAVAQDLAQYVDGFVDGKKKFIIGSAPTLSPKEEERIEEATAKVEKPGSSAAGIAGAAKTRMTGARGFLGTWRNKASPRKDDAAP
jgi:hypothetical protein